MGNSAWSVVHGWIHLLTSYLGPRVESGHIAPASLNHSLHTLAPPRTHYLHAGTFPALSLASCPEHADALQPRSKSPTAHFYALPTPLKNPNSCIHLLSRTTDSPRKCTWTTPAHTPAPASSHTEENTCQSNCDRSRRLCRVGWRCARSPDADRAIMDEPPRVSPATPYVGGSSQRERQARGTRITPEMPDPNKAGQLRDRSHR